MRTSRGYCLLIQPIADSVVLGSSINKYDIFLPIVIQKEKGQKANSLRSFSFLYLRRTIWTATLTKSCVRMASKETATGRRRIRMFYAIM